MTEPITPQRLKTLAAQLLASGKVYPEAAKMLQSIAAQLEADHSASLEALISRASADAQSCHHVFERIRQARNYLDKTLAMPWLLPAAAHASAARAGEKRMTAGNLELQLSTPSDGFECYYLVRGGATLAEISGPQTEARTAALQEIVDAANGPVRADAQEAPQPEDWHYRFRDPHRGAKWGPWKRMTGSIDENRALFAGRIIGETNRDETKMAVEFRPLYATPQPAAAQGEVAAIQALREVLKHAQAPNRDASQRLDRIEEACRKGLEGHANVAQGAGKPAGCDPCDYPECGCWGSDSLKRLGARLADLLDADHWNNIEPLLLNIEEGLKRSHAGLGPVAGPNVQTVSFDDNSGSDVAWHKVQDQIDAWAQETLGEHAAVFLSWSDRLAQHLCNHTPTALTEGMRGEPAGEQWVDVTDGTTMEGDRFTYIMNPKTGIGDITSHKRRVSDPSQQPSTDRGSAA